MENKMENKESNVSKNNRKDIIYIGIIVFLIVIICTLIYLFVIKDNANNLQNDNNDKDSINNVENNNEKLELITDNDLISKLQSKVLTSDNKLSLYSKSLNINDVNSENIITFSIRQYLLDNKIDYKSSSNIIVDGNKSCWNGDGDDFIKEGGYRIPKSIIKEYIKNKFNTTNEYEFKERDNKYPFDEKFYHFNEGLAVASINDEYVIGCLSATSTNNYYLQKAIKAEKSNDYIYLYDKALLCDGSTVLSCMNIVSSNNISDLFSCYDDNDDVKSVCVENGNLDLKKTATYVMNNMYDKISSYKHTFKKGDNGEYYWISTELID